MKAQKERARAARKNAGADAWLGESNLLEDIPETKFAGYESLSCQAKILAIVKDGQRVENALEGDEVVILTDRTPCLLYTSKTGCIGVCRHSAGSLFMRAEPVCNGFGRRTAYGGSGSKPVDAGYCRNQGDDLRLPAPPSYGRKKMCIRDSFCILPILWE